MAISEAYANSASIGTTEYSLTNNSTTIAAQTDDGVYQAFLDLSALTITELYELRVYEKCRSSSTQRVAGRWFLAGPLTDPVFVIESMIFLHGWDVTLKKISGTDRTIEWSIRKVA